VLRCHHHFSTNLKCTYLLGWPAIVTPNIFIFRLFSFLLHSNFRCTDVIYFVNMRILLARLETDTRKSMLHWSVRFPYVFFALAFLYIFEVLLLQINICHFCHCTCVCVFPPIVGAGVQTGSTWHVGHLLAYCTCPGWLWGWRIWWNEWQGKPKYSEKTCSDASLSTTNPTWPDPGLNLGRCSGKPATNRFSYGAAVCACVIFDDK
jgi:hypothetical protein